MLKKSKIIKAIHLINQKVIVVMVLGFKKLTGIDKLEQVVKKKNMQISKLHVQIEKQREKITSMENINAASSQVAQYYKRKLKKAQKKIDAMKSLQDDLYYQELRNEKIQNSLITKLFDFDSIHQNNFIILTARKVFTKPFDYSDWEVLFVKNGVVDKIKIKRYVHEDLVDVLQLIQHTSSINEILSTSLTQVKGAV